MSDRQSTICPDNLYLQARDIHLQLKDVYLQPEDIHLYPKDRLIHEAIRKSCLHRTDRLSVINILHSILHAPDGPCLLTVLRHKLEPVVTRIFTRSISFHAPCVRRMPISGEQDVHPGDTSGLRIPLMALPVQDPMVSILLKVIKGNNAEMISQKRHITFGNRHVQALARFVVERT